MRRNFIVSMIVLTTLLGNAAWAQGDATFTVRNIRLDGLQRISEGAVYNYLPVDIGDELNPRRIQEALRATYASGFFTDVQMKRDGDTLVIVVKERPSILSFVIEGNKDIKTEDLENSLRGVGLAQGLPFDHSVLDEVERSLTQEYFSRGKYAAIVKTEVENLDENRVSVAVNITEGDRAQIKQINFVGNTVFDDDTLRDEMKLRTPSLLSWFKKDDRYSKEALSGDLESLTSFYMDRGYADFDVNSTQVAISPNKEDVFITVNIKEGDIYTVSDVKLSGDLVISEEELKRFVLIKPGQTFSRKLMTQTNELIQFRLGQDGYARAEVQPLPEIDEETKTMSLDMRVVAGNRVYVRNIKFAGTENINDETLRREMRQMEGGWLSNTAVERSEERIRRLPYIEEVASETVPVSGSDDLVDVEFQVKEGLPGQWGGGIGYSGFQGLLLNGNFTHSNFLGTGNRVGLDINTGSFSTVYRLSHSDPYASLDGISRNVSLSYSDTTQFISGASDFDSKNLLASLQYGIPMSEYSSFRYGGSFQSSELATTSRGGSRQSLDFINLNGDSIDIINNSNGVCGSDFLQNDVCGTKFHVFEMFAGYTFDSRDRFIFPTKGMRHQLSVSMAVPGSKVEYYVASYDFLGLYPVWRDFILSLNMELAFGDAINETTDLPPFKNFFAGGPDSVRGFRQGQLGPLDSRGNPYGGNMKTIAQLELIIPTPEKFKAAARVSLFYDIGNVFYTGSGTSFRDYSNVLTPELYLNSPIVDYSFDESALRQSIGLSVQWLAPLGTFKFSYAYPLNEFEGRQNATGNFILFPDEIERFQFTVGRSF